MFFYLVYVILAAPVMDGRVNRVLLQVLLAPKLAVLMSMLTDSACLKLNMQNMLLVSSLLICSSKKTLILLFMTCLLS